MELAATGAEQVQIKPITAADLDWALAQGWDDFKAKRGDLLLLPLIYAVIGFAAAFFAFNASFWPLIFPLVGGFALVGPLAAAGFYEIAKRRERGQDSSWTHFLDPLRGPSRVPMLGLTVMLVLIFFAWMVSAQAIYAATLGPLAIDTPEGFAAALTATSQGWTMIVVGNLVGALFATFTLAVAAFSFPLVIDTPVPALTAVAASLAAFRRSPLVMLRWGVMVAFILAVAALPLFVGLIVALPVLGYATWHLYTRAVRIRG